MHSYKKEGNLFRHLVALRDLSPGELIFSELPVATGPGESRDTCSVCYNFIEDTVCNRSEGTYNIMQRSYNAL